VVEMFTSKTTILAVALEDAIDIIQIAEGCTPVDGMYLAIALEDDVDIT